MVPAWVARRVGDEGMWRPAWLLKIIVRLPQWLAERRQRAQRRELLKQDLRMERNFSFGKPDE